MNFSDKLLPNQPLLRSLYLGNNIEKDLHEKILDITNTLSVQDKFKLVESDRFKTDYMASSPAALTPLFFLIKLAGVKKIIEVGTFIGLSAMYFAGAIGEGASIVTIEKFHEFAEIARFNFTNNQFSNQINLIEGDARDIIKTLPDDGFDLAFIDGHKENYKEYFLLLVHKIKPGGLLVIDDAFFNGDILNKTPTSEKGRGVKEALDYIKFIKWNTTLLPISNGILICQKPKNL